LVGDSSVDILTGRNAGVSCWVLPYGYNGGRPIEDAHPDQVIADVSVLLTAVQARPARRPLADAAVSSAEKASS